MIVNLDRRLLSLAGTPLVDKDQELTVGNVLASVLDQTTVVDRRKAYRLAQKCSGSGEVDFTPEEMETIMVAVDAFPLQSTVIVGQLLEAILENEQPEQTTD